MYVGAAQTRGHGFQQHVGTGSPGAMAGAFHGGGIRALGALSGAVGIKLGDQLLWS